MLSLAIFQLGACVPSWQFLFTVFLRFGFCFFCLFGFLEEGFRYSLEETVGCGG